MRTKYHNTKTTVDGHQFDSIKEAGRYWDLKLLQKSGKITDLELQPRFLLQRSFKYQKKTMRKIEYVADFKYKDTSTGETIVEDVKGFKTDVYKLKKKIFLKKYGDKIKFLEI